MLFILKKLCSPCRGLWSGNEWQNTSSLCYAAHYTNLFKVKCRYIFKTNTNRTYIISSKENMHRNVEEIGNFSLWRDYVIMTKHCPPSNQTYKLQVRCWAWNQHSSKELVLALEWKCSLNAEIFKRKLQRIPLIKLSENDLQTMDRTRAFEQRIAT